MILVIDDSPEDVFFHRRMIHRIDRDAVVKDFAYAEDALDFIADIAPTLINLILLDINLPRISGFQFLDHYADLCVDDCTPKIYVMSGSIDPKDREAATASPQVAAYLPKPLQYDVMQEVIRNARLPGVLQRT